MYFLYVDESGDIGFHNSPTRYFILNGFVVHELRWHSILEAIIGFRQKLKKKYGLKLREEIHAPYLIHKPKQLARIKKSLRLQLLRDVIDFEAQLSDVNIVSVVIDKQTKNPEDDIFDMAWSTMIQRFHNTISYKNFRGPQNVSDYGLLIVDRVDEQKLRLLTRKMRKYNPIPSQFIGSGVRMIPITTLVEDAVHRDSLHSYFIQLVDVNAFFLHQKLQPCAYVKKKGGKNYYSRLDSVLCKCVCNTNCDGIVYR